MDHPHVADTRNDPRNDTPVAPAHHSEIRSNRRFSLTCFRSSTQLHRLKSLVFIRIVPTFSFPETRSVVAQEVLRLIDKRPIWWRVLSVEVNNMRIICDQCDLEISGTVKRLFGNFNLHPDCLIRFAEGPTTSKASTLHQQSPKAALVKREQNALVSSLELVRA